MNPYILALLAALSFALGAVLQQRGTLQTKAAEGDPNFLKEIIRKPVWLMGGLMQVCGWVLQAVALGKGSMVVVQSLCVLSLVFALPLGARLTNQHIGRRSIIGASATLVGIVALVALGQPQGGISQPESAAWLTSGIIIIVLIVILAGFARRRRGSLAAALFASAAGFSFAYQASVTKVFMNSGRIWFGCDPDLLVYLCAHPHRPGRFRLTAIRSKNGLPGTRHGCQQCHHPCRECDPRGHFV